MVVLIASRSVSAAASAVNKLLLKQSFIKKALRSLLLSAFFSSGVFAEGDSRWQLMDGGCRWSPSVESLQSVNIAHVYDGDTVRLSDGRRVRLLGINTPELARDKRPDQFYARAATAVAEKLVGQGRWFLLLGQRSRDRHGRTLGYLLDGRGVSLGSMLVARGAAMWVAQGADDTHVVCMEVLEQRAKDRSLGLWQGVGWREVSASKASKARLGFQRLRGVVTKVDRAREHDYLELDDRVVLKLPRGLIEFSEGWEGRELRVRGWLISRKLSVRQQERGYKSLVMNVSSRRAIRLLL